MAIEEETCIESEAETNYCKEELNLEGQLETQYMEEHFKELKRIMNLPSMIYRPKLVIDGGTRWMAIYDDLFGVGNSPAQAMDDFDKKFYRDINIGGVIK